MASVNTAVRRTPIHTHEGARASHINPEQQLRRLVMSCLLWEGEFYVDGKAIAEQIREAVGRVKPDAAARIAIEAREQSKLRHVPLWIVREMARLQTHKHLVADTLARVIQRPDELSEFVALYWKDGKCPLSAQVKRGLARAFEKFDEYQLAKYNRDAAVKLRDVLFLSHAKPGSPEREALYKKLVDGTLTTPDTWEVALSGGADKRATFERLIAENKLGALALLRNLRNMQGAGVSKVIVQGALATMRTDRVLPFRFVAAARAVPQWEDIIEPPMLRMLEGATELPGATGLLLDVSGSMDAQMSVKSDMMRIDAGAALGILMREICESVIVATFSNSLVVVPPRRGFALRDAIVQSQPHGGTYLGSAVAKFQEAHNVDRLIVITDEQSHDPVRFRPGRNYLVNVASARNGVAYNETVHIDGWSESVINFIMQHEMIGEPLNGGAEYADESATA